ncbi:hypothetical protein SAMN05444392_10122 [Seinonella peptonophila]|uniref:DUF554 domain-containing protein n=1 Tax=Seinonella peptonophila TaxID=112248 RepID=A0A1M4SKT8_9BACL|nr:DUF554 domain-containing protein [Seinonella peptonophila]SHE32799.1 hypothetical protein SAMN05444392_10122 [Seinonella peptonophila]
MVLLGAIVNGVAIILGSLLGAVFTKIPERVKQTILQAFALSVLMMGIDMSLKSQHLLYVVISIALGVVIGEYLNIEESFQRWSIWLEERVGRKESDSLSKGFVTCTLIYIVGAMPIIGALDSGLRNDHTLFYIKACIDGLMALFLTTTLGKGVLFSAIPVIIYQVILTLLATQISYLVSSNMLDQIIQEITGTGGILVMGIGMNMLGLIKIRVGNMLPSLVIVILLIFFRDFF